MASYRFVHCADLHLDSPLRGLEADPDAPAERIRRATRDALTNLVQLALDEQVALVVIAGDLYDGDWPDWHTGQFLWRKIEELTRAGIHVVAIRGNHDAESVITRQLPWNRPGGARLLAADRAETAIFPELNTAVHGRSFATKEVLDNLVLSYPRAVPGMLNIGLLHTAAEGAAGHRSYAPCSIKALVDFGYDYWALGHVHTRRVLAENPWVVFPGNIQGRDIGETGDKGATLVIVENNRIIQKPEHRSLDVVRWKKIEIDVTGAEDEDAVMAQARAKLSVAQQAADGRLLAARVRLIGACAAHAALTRSLADTRERLKAEVVSVGGGETTWIERVEVATTPALDPRLLSAHSDTLGRLIREIETAAAGDLAKELQEWAKPLLERAPQLRAELGEHHPAVQTADGKLPADLIARAKALLLSRLAEPPGGQR